MEEMRKGPKLIGGGLTELLVRLHRDEEGQAVVEYILMVSATIVSVGALSFGFRKTLFKIWEMFARDITAACPGCPPEDKIRLR
jgi:Flp pilus assembly pilin Flp